MTRSDIENFLKIERQLVDFEDKLAKIGQKREVTRTSAAVFVPEDPF